MTQFMPLTVGNEWVYFDTTWDIFGGGTGNNHTGLERTVTITVHGDDTAQEFWVATVTRKGFRYRWGTDDKGDFGIFPTAIDSSDTDTLRRAADGTYSDGMKGLFAWLAYAPSDTNVTYTLQQSGKRTFLQVKAVFIGEVSGVSVGSSSDTICAESSAGMLFREYESGSIDSHRSGKRSVLLRFNGMPVNPD
jgi:hypothetical protein